MEARLAHSQQVGGSNPPPASTFKEYAVATPKRAKTGRLYYAQDTPKAVAKASARKRARRIMERKYGKAALKGKDVDHIKPLSKGGTNALSNLRLVPSSKNRARNKR